MRNIYIPQLIPAGGFSPRQKMLLLLALLMALLLHAAIYFGAVYAGFNPLIFIFPEQTPPPPSDQALQFVLIDEEKIDEQLPDELKPSMRGRANRVSRDETINPDLPKNGPSSDEQTALSAFRTGAPVPTEAGAPAVKPQPPAPPMPQPQPQAPQVQPTPPSPQQPVKKPVEAVKPTEPEETVPEISKIIEQAAPEMDTALDVPGLLPEAFDAQKKPDTNPQKSEFTQKQDAEHELQEKKIDKIQPRKDESLDKVAEKKPDLQRPQPAQPPMQQQPTQTAQNALPKTPPPSRYIPTRKIGEKPRDMGGKMSPRAHSSAMLPGIKSMAVLRDRYGEYMDLVLRRIQEAILIQQQLSPIMFQHGAVIMTFSINEWGKLGNINFIKAIPVDMSAETAAARRVLDDVAGGKPFPPPTAKMLADPDFRKITINFVFEVQ